MSCRKKQPPAFVAEIYCPTTGKVYFPTKQKAYQAAEKLKGPKGRTLQTIYKCFDCGGYHLSHKSKRRNNDTKNNSNRSGI